ncbi:MAG: DUF5312 domain-containing protein [Treponema sp.]|jgi:hypothetical protein|nr:DUF5312 domain-containing protein [Treponema sp.]
MAENDTFDRLVTDMPLDERLQILEKITHQTDISTLSLYEGETEASFDSNVEAQFARTPWYERMLLIIISFFKNSSPLKVFESRQIVRLGKFINSQAPGMYDYQRNFLLPKFHETLDALKNSARYFYITLDASVQRNKDAFYAFLSSLVLGEQYNVLKNATIPANLLKTHPKVSDTELHQVAFSTIEHTLEDITAAQRKIMYTNIRTLICLKELSSFLYDRVLLSFSFEPSLAGKACSGHIIREQLINLNNILFSFRNPPSSELLESLFMFVLQNRKQEENFDRDSEMIKLLEEAKQCLDVVRVFNKYVPLTLILRCISHNMALAPSEIAGGEDWFVTFREYWKEQFEKQFTEYSREKHQKTLTDSFKDFLKGKSLKELEFATSDPNAETGKIYIDNLFALSFLKTFYEAVFLNDVNNVLRPIVFDGEFVRRENKIAFTESYNDILKLDDAIKDFEETISPEGQLGKRFENAVGDVSSLPGKRRRIQLILDEAHTESHKIVDTTQAALKNLISILAGIPRRDANGQYDILVNMAKFMGKDIMEFGDGPQGKKAQIFLNGIADTLQKLQKTSQILEEIDTISKNLK